MEPDLKLSPYIGFSREDRDLLIELRTNVAIMTRDIKSLGDNTGATIQDHEGRLRFLERWVWVAIGVISVGELAFSYLHK